MNRPHLPLRRRVAALMLGMLVPLAPFAACRAQGAGADPSSGLSEHSLYRVTGRWTNFDGRELSLAELRGAPVVLAMVYTSCTMTCPLITSEMLAVQRALPADLRARVRFVLASFDPARDSVGALRQHAEKMSLDGRWLVLRAAPTDVRRLAVLLGVSYRQLPSGDFDHSNIISVLDSQGVVSFQSPRIPADRDALVEAVSAAARPASRPR